MRPPENGSLPKTIDPYQFARSRGLLNGTLLLAEAQELNRWQTADGKGIIRAHLAGYTDRDSRPHLKGQLTTELELECQRCLQPLPWQADIRFDYRLIRSEAQDKQEYSETETLICAEDELDLAWFVEEEVLLSMPMIAKHEHCTLPKELTQASEKAEQKHNPFADLRNLMNNKEQP